MATPAERLIYADIKTTLEAILTSGGYKSDVDAVELVYRTWVSAGELGSTVIGIVPMESLYTPITFRHYRVRLNIVLAAHVKATTNADRYDKLLGLIDDIIAALNVDVTRGSNAICTVIDRVVTDMGDPDTLDASGGTGSATVALHCEYERTDEST